MFLAGSMLSSLLMFVVIVEIIHRRPAALGQTGFGQDAELVRYVFYALSIVIVLVARVVRGFMLRGTKSSDIHRLVARLNSANVITFGLADAPVIMGLVLFVGWRHYTDFYILGFISLYLMLRHFPRYGSWESFVARQMGDKWVPAGPVDP